MAKTKRPALSVKTRFEVLKRDDFTCRYCGRRTPDVVLQVDHVIPVAEGGGDDFDNLATSCWECNSGKGARSLSDTVPLTDLEEKSILLLERERQLREYNEVRRIVREREEDQINELLCYWDDALIGKCKYLPESNSVRGWLQRFCTEHIKRAMQIAIDKKGFYVHPRYVSGILRVWEDQGVRGLEAE